MTAMAVIQRFGEIVWTSNEGGIGFARGLWSVASEPGLDEAPTRPGMVRLATIARILPRVRQNAGRRSRGVGSVC
jgi:hypothetical protein